MQRFSHNQGVRATALFLVIMRPQAAFFKAHLLVERDGGFVVLGDFKKQILFSLPAIGAAELAGKRGGDALAAKSGPRGQRDDLGFLSTALPKDKSGGLLFGNINEAEGRRCFQERFQKLGRPAAALVKTFGVKL